ncbi:hypothetical protein [Saccharopolyspora pogona]|uniref:hypothetical protein n=1 Tax=Saccharopolyspora pogona TaxID=333966 RepID=UPI0016843CE9|nr:hypothetical protein [Saccharopolyspora pogona]
MPEKTPMLATVHHKLGKPGGPGLFHDKSLSLPPYVENIAHSLMRKRGLPKSQAIRLALGAVERWKNGGDDVSPEVRAAAAKAWAQWEAAKAKAKATPNKRSDHANDASAVDVLLSGPDGGRDLLLSASQAGVIDLAALHQWKHNWVPLTPYAAAIKAKMARGSTRGKGPDLPKPLQKRAAELHGKHGKSVVHGSYGHSEAPLKPEPKPAAAMKKSTVPTAKRPASPSRKPVAAAKVTKPARPNRETHQVKSTLFDFPALPDDAHPALREKRQAILDKAAKIKAPPKPSKRGPQPSKAPKPGTGEFTPKPGEPGGKVTFAGDRTGTVWSDAPHGGKWVIPDQRQPGEAHAIYLDKHGHVHKEMSSREYQQNWLAGRRAQVEASTPKARKAAEAQAQKLRNKVETAQTTVGGRPFKNLTADELNQVDRSHGHLRASKEYVRGGRTISDLVKVERERRAGETKLDDVRKTALADASEADKKFYYAAYQRRLDSGMSPMDAHVKALQDMVNDRLVRRTSLSSRPGNAVELARIIHQIRKVQAAA